MSTEAAPDGVARVVCPVCEVDVPAGAFCGLCGGHLTSKPSRGPHWLRQDTFGAAPNESVLVPSIASSLFPHLPNRSRTPFRIGLVLVLAGLVGFAFLRLPAALITVAALGLPLLFLLYLSESDVFRDVSVAALAVAGILGAGFGVGWVLLTGEMVARAYGVPIAAGLAIHHLVREGVIIPAGGMILTLVPTLLVRLSQPKSRESLDGFVIGALAALTFSAGATLTRLAPQFATGLLAHSRPVGGLLVEAGICGATIPLTAAVAGGLVGVALWFKGQDGNPHEHPGWTRAQLWLLAVLVVLIYVGVAVTDIVGMPQMQMLAIHVVMTAVVLVLLRIALQTALLHEARDPIQEDEPLLCVHCEHVVPDMAFCPACGVAARASSRSSRKDRRDSRPVRQVAAEGS
ncbi:zinc ribbon domain-containing protein [Candidatus Mycolicibacterium alkanivorans]|uniref:Zinc ribbon domain-containing protein n=1 Tax=Candidatus Mycolicibacterium alkanivorans TaxID=2954114 RepID=A0ABS9YV37_9MYCO|nr:zinc ribbon domain-containing protein [Candidatus Mycolicibacterium alkanivorans]MCI4674229.1 zinc ribbon domain-containing protein [Candidatus Mycolicibacterium alkanivorans]